MKRVRIVNKRRFITSLTLMLLLVVTSLSVITGAIYSEGLSDQKYINYTVVSGDTLWSIAKNYTETGKDVRDMIYKISDENKLATTAIHPGEILVIPVNE